MPGPSLLMVTDVSARLKSSDVHGNTEGFTNHTVENECGHFV